jgi:hypothetical protein
MAVLFELSKAIQTAKWNMTSSIFVIQEEMLMTVRILRFRAFASVALFLLPSMARSQNAQCTILSAQDFGKAVPITVDPAPPLNAVCQVGKEEGYVSRTSSGIGVNINANCTITVSGHTIQAAYEAHPSVIKSPCRVGNVSGFISSSFAPAGQPSPPVAQSIPPFYRWQPASNGAVPKGAVIGGYSSVQPQAGSTAVSYGTPYYVCRAAFNGDLFPGKVVGKNCNFSAATDKEILAPSYEVLTAQSAEYSLQWRQSAAPPANALVGGHWGENLYLCQLPYEGGLHPGWAIPAKSGLYLCYIGWSGKQITLAKFSYLVPVKGQRID